jgi:antitoxin (DNA-binding transcriptional repressor) of toxin-antitoxin stability system
VSEPVTSVHAEESPSWAEVVRRAEHGDTVAVIAHGEHVADVVPSGELDRLRDTVEVLSDTELTARSAHDSRGRLTGRRSTATSCRSTRIRVRRSCAAGQQSEPGHKLPEDQREGSLHRMFW